MTYKGGRDINSYRFQHFTYPYIFFVSVGQKEGGKLGEWEPIHDWELCVSRVRKGGVPCKKEKLNF